MSSSLRKFRALDRRRKVVALYARGRSQLEIAELLGVDRGDGQPGSLGDARGMEEAGAAGLSGAV